MNNLRFLFFLIFFCFLSLGAQKQAGYFGTKNLIGLEYNLFPAIFFSQQVKVHIPVLNAIKYERRINSIYTGGMTLRINQYKINDEFANDGYPHNYDINYLDVHRMVNNGKGVCALSSVDMLFQLKRFAKYRGFSPYGKFKAIKIGISHQTIRINKGYEFVYTEFYGDLRKPFVVSENQSLDFNKLQAGIEIGRTVRFFDDRWLLSYSLNLMTSFKHKFDPEASLNERFMFEAEKFIMNNQLVSLNFDLSYAF